MCKFLCTKESLLAKHMYRKLDGLALICVLARGRMGEGWVESELFNEHFLSLSLDFSQDKCGGANYNPFL